MSSLAIVPRPGETSDEQGELAKMRRRFTDAEDGDSINRVAALECIEFYYGEQWADDIEKQRRDDGRPCFTLNKLPSILKQVINDNRRNPPAIQINPVADGADEKKAQIRQGLTTHVETNSDAPTVYEQAFVYLLVGGFASWRVTHDFLPMSFDQELYLKSIANPFSVYWDPRATELDRGDARYCFVTTDLDPDAYEEEYPNSELAGLQSFAGIGNRAMGWGSQQAIRVVEYFDVKLEKLDLVRLVDGSAKWEDELKKTDRVAKKGGKPIYREDNRKAVWYSKANGFEYLEQPEKLKIDEIPVISIFANEMIVNDTRRWKGAVFDIREAQKLFNYNSSAIGESMALGSKANWLATIEQIEQYLTLWQNSNKRAMAVLPYKHIPGVNAPSKVISEPPIQAMSLARQQSSEDLRSISGVYDQTAQPGNIEESGNAILERRHQTAQGNADYASSLGIGVKRTARIVNKYFKYIYDTPRVLRIMGGDKQPTQIMVHSGMPESVPSLLPDDVKGVFDLTEGTYDYTVTLTIGEETRRQQAVRMLLALVQANPAMAPIVADLLVNEMDIPGKEAIVQRLRRALPPNLQEDPNQTKDPAALAAHNAQMQQQLQALSARVQELMQVIKGKQIESQSRERVEGMKIQAAQVRADGALQTERLKAQSNILTHAADKNFDAIHDHAMSEKEHIHGMMENAQEAALNPPAPAAPVQGA